MGLCQYQRQDEVPRDVTKKIQSHGTTKLARVTLRVADAAIFEPDVIVVRNY